MYGVSSISDLRSTRAFTVLDATPYNIVSCYNESRFHQLTKRYPLQYIPRNMHTVFALLCFVVVIHWLIFPYPPGLLHWHCGNLTIAPVPAKQPLRNMDKYFMWIHYERLHNHNKAKHNKTVCIFLGIYCTCVWLISYRCYIIMTSLHVMASYKVGFCENINRCSTITVI